MKKNFIGILALFVLFFAACAPAPMARVAAKDVFPLKLNEVWELRAFKPAEPAPQVFPFELYDEPEFDEDGDVAAFAEAGKYEAEMYYLIKDQVLLVAISLTKGSDPELVFCVLDTSRNKVKLTGTSFFGRTSELQTIGSLPRTRFAVCELSRK